MRIEYIRPSDGKWQAVHLYQEHNIRHILDLLLESGTEYRVIESV